MPDDPHSEASVSDDENLESAPAGTDDDAAGEETVTEPATKSSVVSPAVAVIGFIIITLLGVLIFQNFVPRQPSGTEPYESTGMASLKADLETRRAELNRTRVSLGLEPIASGQSVETAEQVSARIKEDASTLSALAQSFESLIQEKDSEIDRLREESVSALKDQKRLRDLLGSAKSDLDKAMMDASYATTLKSDLESARARITALEKDLAEAREVPQSLRERLAASESENTELHRRISELVKKLNEATIFAGTASEIRPEAVALYQALQDLEGKADSEISTAYSRFGAKLGANVMRTCTFATGSADVAPPLDQELAEIARQAPKNAMLFVVGYASETGNVDANRALSSNRATNVARMLNGAKDRSQKVQAAYLGQTDRFSSRIPERNQIVEIWEISKRSD
ncbi:OmpA family protein [Haloferula sargassicola]|uniref:OmpA-like domain-containing protein n=1 Tax=Haloferula sargassicola TaxID=490096 RepID=A0ABP9UJ66_9BACT